MALSVQEVLKLLHVPQDTLYRWIRQGAIPCQYRHGNYYFDQEVITSWAKAKQIPIDLFSQNTSNDLSSIDLLQAIQQGEVLPQVSGNTPHAVFHDVETQATCLPKFLKESLADRLCQRERLAPTAVGNGVALPHPQYSLEGQLTTPLILIAFLNEPCDFQAADQMPIFALFVLLSVNPSSHLKLLSQLTSILKQTPTIDFLKGHPNKDEILQTFQTILG